MGKFLYLPTTFIFAKMSDIWCRIIGALIGLSLMPLALWASAYKGGGDAIVGKWLVEQNGEKSYATITRSSNGTYECRLYWVEHSRDSAGNTYLDKKNPDKSLRNTPIDNVVLFSGLKYDASKNAWSGTKIYDPTRGIKANVNCTMEDENTIKLRGTVLGIGETVYWKRLPKD